MIDPKSQCIFIHQRKVAGISIISAFGWRPNDPEWHAYNEGVAGEQWARRSFAERSYLVFSAVRNPFDRLISSWKYLDSCRDRPLIDVLRDPPKDGHGYRHLVRPQVALLRDPHTGRLVTDMLVRYERLQKHFNGVRDRLGLPRVKLHKTNMSVRNADYRSYFSDEARERATAMFKDDLETFGYSF